MELWVWILGTMSGWYTGVPSSRRKQMNRKCRMSTEGLNGMQASWGHFLILESDIMGATDTRCCEVALGGPARDRVLGWRSTGLTASPPRGQLHFWVWVWLCWPHCSCRSHTPVCGLTVTLPRLCRLNRSGGRGKSHWTWGVFIYGRQAPKGSVGRIPGRGECGWEKLYLCHESWQKTMMVSLGLKTMMISAGLMTLSLIETTDIFIPHSTVVDEPLMFHLKCWFWPHHYFKITIVIRTTAGNF